MLQFIQTSSDRCVIFLMHVQMQITNPPPFFFMLLLLLKHRGRIFSLRENTNKHKPVESSEFIH